MLMIGIWLLYFVVIGFCIAVNRAKNGFAWTDFMAFFVMIFPFWYGTFFGLNAAFLAITVCLFIWHNIRRFDNARKVEMTLYLVFFIMLAFA